MDEQSTKTRVARDAGLSAIDEEFLLDCAGYKTSITGWGSWMTSCAGGLAAKELMDRRGGSYILNRVGRLLAQKIHEELFPAREAGDPSTSLQTEGAADSLTSESALVGRSLEPPPESAGLRTERYNVDTLRIHLRQGTVNDVATILIQDWGEKELAELYDELHDHLNPIGDDSDLG